MPRSSVTMIATTLVRSRFRLATRTAGSCHLARNCAEACDTVPPQVRLAPLPRHRYYSTSAASQPLPASNERLRTVYDLRRQLVRHNVEDAWAAYQAADKDQLDVCDYLRMVRLVNLNKRTSFDRSTIEQYFSIIMEVMEDMRARGIALDTPTINHLMCQFGRVKRIDIVEQLWQQAVMTGGAEALELDVNSYNNLLFAYAMVENHKGVWETWQFMQEAGVRPNSFTFDTLIKLHGRNGDSRAAMDTFRSMLAAADGPAARDGARRVLCRPTTHTYNALIDALGRNGKLDDARAIFDLMQTPSRINKLKALGVSMPRNGKRTRPMPNRDTFHRLIKWHALHGETHHAQAYLDLMRSATYNIQPTHQTFKHIINRRVATKDWDFTLGVATLMQDKLNLPLIESMANSLARAWDYIQERSRARAERELLERERREAMRTQLFAAEEVAAESDDMGQRP